MTVPLLEKITTVTMSFLFAAMTAIMATSIVAMTTGTLTKGATANKDEEIDGYTAAIVQKAVSGV